MLDSEVSWTCNNGGTVVPADASMKSTITFPAVGTYTVTAKSNPELTRTVYVTNLNIATTAPNPAGAGTAYSYTLNDLSTPAGGTYMWEYQKQGDSAWTAVTGGTINPVSIALPGASLVTSTYSVRCTSNLISGLPPVQSSPITVGPIPPPTVSLVSFGVPTESNYILTDPWHVSAYLSPVATETLVNYNVFGDANYKFAPTFVGTSQIVASGIAVIKTGGTYSTTCPGSFSYCRVSGGATQQYFRIYDSASTGASNFPNIGYGNNYFSVRTVAAPESRYAYIYFARGDETGTQTVTVTANVLDAAGLVVATTGPQAVTANAKSSYYRAKVAFFGGVTGVNLDVKFAALTTSGYYSYFCGAAIVTKP